jgi:uncharacterized membrane protein
MKVTQPLESLKKNMSWVAHVPVWAVRVVGILEILGGLGLILPAVTHIAPILTAIAAAALVLTMIGAIITHVVLKETNRSIAPLVLLILALFLAYGRFFMVHLT